MDRRKQQWDGQHGWPILQVVGKFLETRKLKRGMVSWLGKTAKSLFNISFSFLFFSFSFITKVEYGKISHDKSQSHKGVIAVTE